MSAPHMIDPARLLGEALAEASPDLICVSCCGRDQHAALREDLEVIGWVETGMPTARFCMMIGAPDRTWRGRSQASTRAG